MKKKPNVLRLSMVLHGHGEVARLQAEIEKAAQDGAATVTMYWDNAEIRMKPAEWRKVTFTETP